MTVGLNPRGQYTLDSHPKDSIVFRRVRHHLLHALLSSLIFTCKNCLECDIFHYFNFFTKYIALLFLIVKKWSLHISYNMKNISLSFYSILCDILNLYTSSSFNKCIPLSRVLSHWKLYTYGQVSNPPFTIKNKNFPEMYNSKQRSGNHGRLVFVRLWRKVSMEPELTKVWWC